MSVQRTDPRLATAHGTQRMQRLMEVGVSQVGARQALACRVATSPSDRARLSALLEAVTDSANSDYGKIKFSMNIHSNGGW